MEPQFETTCRGHRYRCNRAGKGVWVWSEKRQEWQQCCGTAQTPLFKSRQHLYQFCYHRFDTGWWSASVAACGG